MSEQTITGEEFELAIKVIDSWHKERGLGFVLVNTGSFVVARSGRPLSLQAALEHSAKQVEMEIAQQFMMAKQAAEAAGQAKSDKLETN